MSKSLTFLSPEELKVGDTVGIVLWIHAGWSRYYRHPCVEKATVEKISAKRKSFKIGDRTFSDKDLYDRIVVYNDIAMTENELALKYKKCSDLKYKLENSKSKYGNLLITLESLDDEDLDKVMELLSYLDDKYRTAILTQTPLC